MRNPTHKPYQHMVSTAASLEYCTDPSFAVSIRADLSSADIIFSSQLSGSANSETGCRARFTFDVHSSNTGLVVDHIDVRGNVDLSPGGSVSVWPRFNHGDDTIVSSPLMSYTHERHAC
jgi:hypothetical protein